MRRGLAIGLIAAVAVLGGSAVTIGRVTGAGDMPVSCATEVSAPWAVSGSGTYRITAAASGPDCADANVTLAVRLPNGTTILRFASAAADLLPLFADATTSPAMTAALHRWIRQPHGGHTARELPAWTIAAEEPGANGFAFHPEPLVSRAYYERLRRWGEPTFCFQQGAAREACYALDGKADRLTLIGTRSWQARAII